MTLLASYQSFLARYTGQTDIIVGAQLQIEIIEKLRANWFLCQHLGLSS